MTLSTFMIQDNQFRMWDAIVYMSACLMLYQRINLEQFWLVVKVKEQLVFRKPLYIHCTVAEYSHEIWTLQFIQCVSMTTKSFRNQIFLYTNLDRILYFSICIGWILKRWHDTLLAHCYHSIYFIPLNSSAIILFCKHQNAFYAMAVSRLIIFLFTFCVSFLYSPFQEKIPNWLDARYHNGNKWETRITYSHQLNRLSVWCQRWWLFMLSFVYMFWLLSFFLFRNGMTNIERSQFKKEERKSK